MDGLFGSKKFDVHDTCFLLTCHFFVSHVASEICTSSTNVCCNGEGKPEADVVIIGSGIGGLCCAGLLARYQQDVLVLESHDQPGGAAHAFEISGYKFDSGPSLFSGFQSRGLQANPLAQVFNIVFLWLTDYLGGSLEFEVWAFDM